MNEICSMFFSESHLEGTSKNRNCVRVVEESVQSQWTQRLTAQLPGKDIWVATCESGQTCLRICLACSEIPDLRVKA